ncbi:MAG: molybdopterin molybdotransferase MoeA [Candidatus Anammoxibacter sp.]
MISVDDAVKIVIDNTTISESQVIDIKDALGFSLAEDIIADMDMPPFNRSAMDGYALISDDISSLPTELDVVETISAGYQPKEHIKNGQAAKIMTGAIVPNGADSVIMVEDTEPVNDGSRVKVLKQIKRGKNIAKMGEDIQNGQVVLKKGKKIRPQEIGVLASVGVNNVNVFRPPSVGVIATGDELVAINTKPKPGQIRNSNSYSIAAQAMQIVSDVEILDIAPDNKEEARQIIEAGLKKDVLILSGGVSMGDYDIIGDILKELGVNIFFEKVALRPGKPTLFGKRGDTLIFALPGNPVATFVTFELFVYPAIQKMMGIKPFKRPEIKAVLKQDYPAKKNRTEYRPAHLSLCNGELSVIPVKWHGSADLLSTTNANCLLIVPDDVDSFAEGQIVDVMLLNNIFGN